MNELENLTKAIAALEAQRRALGDDVVESALVPLRAEVTRLRGNHSAEQRRLVTVLFADLAGFTEMSGRMDPEDLQQIMSAYFGRWKAEIEHHGGRVEKFIGDAVVAVFGLAVAREDDAESAVRAALAMRQDLHTLNHGWQSQGVHLAMRVGIHTGIVMVSCVGDQHDGDFIAVGDAVNVASRLQSAAPVGGVLISHETFTHVRGLFETEELPPLSIKGKDEPILAHLIHGVRPRAFQSASRGTPGLNTRFVGRDAELVTMHQAYRDTWERGARLVFIVGDAGVGKSRLLLEFTREITQHEPCVQYLRARAFPHTSEVPSAVLRTAFASRFGILENDSCAEAQAKFERGAVPYFTQHGTKKASVLGSWLGFEFSHPHLALLRDDPGQLRDRASAHLVELMRGMAASSRMVVLLDDTHWADAQSLTMIAHLLAHVDVPFLVLAGTRPPVPGQQPRWADSGELPSDRLVRIDLAPLSGEATRALALDIVRHVAPIAEPLLSLVIRRAEGNPYFLEELLRMLLEHRETPRAERLASDSLPTAIPSTLAGVLQARLDSLPHAEKTLLQQASVIGRVFWRSALIHLLSTEEAPSDETLDGILRSLLDRQLVFHRPHSTFAGTEEFVFKHALLHETIYETVLKRHRVILHERTARWLEEVAAAGGRSDEYAAVIAQHMERAEDPDAARWYVRAGGHAAARFANADALRHVNRALQLAPQDLPLRFDALLVRESVHKVTADRPAQAQDLALLAGVAEALADRRRMVTVAIRAAHHAYVSADFDAALTSAEEATQLASLLDLPAAQGEACVVRAKVLWRRGEYVESRSAATRALELAELSGEASLKVKCLEAMAHVDAHEGRYMEAMNLEEEALSLARTSGDLAREASALSNMGNLAWYMEDTESAQRYLLESLRLRSEIGDRRGESRVLTSLGNVARTRWELEASVGYQEESLRLSRSIDDLVGISTALANLGEDLRLLGLFDRARPCLEEALAMNRQLGNRNAECIVRGNLGLLCLAEGSLEEAKQCFEEGLRVARQLATTGMEMYFAPYLGRTLLDLGHFNEALPLLQQAVSTGDAAVVPEASASLALLHLALGDRVQARFWADRIASMDEHAISRADDPAWVMLARYEAMKACGQPGAEAVAEAGWGWVQAVAARIGDSALRTSYLEAIKSHRVLAALHKAQSSGTADQEESAHG
ncbi:AAA family ATPase [Candidatus Fermentibacteria bacterium]|nr:AAA family ATPase [Candidatus Fermentibacteria bacterium]